MLTITPGATPKETIYAGCDIDTRRPVSSRECCSGCRLAVKRFALGPTGRPWGDCVAEHPLGGGEVGRGTRRGGDGDGDVLLQAGVSFGVVWGVGLPAAPDDPAPRAAEGSQRAAVVVAAGASCVVAVGGPGVPLAGDVREGPERVAQPLVVCPAELRGLPFLGFDGDGCLSGLRGDRVTVRVACPAVADLGQQGCGADD